MIQEPLSALVKYRGCGSILHSLDKLVDLLCLDAVQVIANGHVKLESVHCAKAVFLCQYLTCKPSLHVLVKCLGHVQLCGPLTVIAFIIRLDTWLCNGKVLAVQLLYGLQFKETAACHVCGYNVLGQLGVGSCRRAKGCLQLTAEYLIVLRLVCNKRSLDPKNSTFLVLLKNPVHQISKWNRCHNIAHFILSSLPFPVFYRGLTLL